ncbi:MAG: hypothetical protein LF888_00485 [Candidatus Megaira endosymbiont of Mesostigma viride]|nr:MAG: hypothetical protein LF888_00485 [Candidatus Megaira endosymbiont of Mesostigma viride]HJK88530.1 hypothetical protein [Candidatus Megaira endosymbiont of Mesostigma viride]
MRFYFKVIEPNRDAIAAGGFNQVSLSTIPEFETCTGLQLEALLLQNRRLLLQNQAFHLSILCIVALTGRIKRTPSLFGI